MIGFETATSNKASFDEFHLMNYVYEPFGKRGNDIMSSYHLLNHLRHADLADSIQPVHADESIQDVLSSIKGRGITFKDDNVHAQVQENNIHQTKHSANSNGHTRKRQQHSQSVAV